MEEFELYFSELEKKIFDLRKRNHDLKRDYDELSEEHQKLKGKYQKMKEEYHKKVEENKEIKLVSAISGNPEYSKLMKIHLNRLIKEVDECIKEFKNIDF